MRNLIIICLLSFSSLGYGAGDWMMNQNGLAIAEPDKNAYVVAILEVVDKGVVVGLGEFLEEATCEGTIIRKVNGTPVRLNSIKHAKTCRRYAASEEGNQFLINEFKTKKQVKIGAYTYSATGFIDTIQEIKDLQSNAL